MKADRSRASASGSASGSSDMKLLKLVFQREDKHATAEADVMDTLFPEQTEFIVNILKTKQRLESNIKYIRYAMLVVMTIAHLSPIGKDSELALFVKELSDQAAGSTDIEKSVHGMAQLILLDVPNNVRSLTQTQCLLAQCD